MAILLDLPWDVLAGLGMGVFVLTSEARTRRAARLLRAWRGRAS